MGRPQERPPAGALPEACVRVVYSQGRNMMFGFRGGESADAVARKRGYVKNAQLQWPFLTNYDLSTIKGEGQLCSMIKTRSSTSAEQAKRDVEAWMQGKEF